MNNISFNLTTSFLQIILFFVLIALIAGLIYSGLDLFRDLKKVSGRKEKLRSAGRSSKFYLMLGFLALISFVTFYIYHLSRQVVVTVSTKQFVKLQEEKLKQLEKEGGANWVEVGLLMIDIRSSEAYAQEHLAGSNSMTVKKVETSAFAADTDIALIYDKNDDQDIRAIAKRIEQLQVDFDRTKTNGQIYVINGDYSALKNAGLATEVGGYD